MDQPLERRNDTVPLRLISASGPPVSGLSEQEGCEAESIIVSIPGAAQYLRITPHAIRRLLSYGLLRRRRSGNRWYVVIPSPISQDQDHQSGWRPSRDTTSQVSAEATGAFVLSPLIEQLRELERSFGRLQLERDQLRAERDVLQRERDDLVVQVGRLEDRCNATMATLSLAAVRPDQSGAERRRPSGIFRLLHR